MSIKNLHTEKLFQYLFFAPYKIQKKFYNYHGEETIDRFYNNVGNCSFMGLLFIDNKVFCYNIQIYSSNENEASRYLDITDVFNKLLNEFNIFHLCYLVHKAIYKYYRENILTEKILPYIRYQNDRRYKSKFTYAVSKHKGRHRLFIEDYRYESKKVWDRILLSSIRKDSSSQQLRHYKNERPNLFTCVYKVLPNINTVTYEFDSTKGLRKSIKKRRVRVKGSIQRRRSLRSSNSNFRLKGYEIYGSRYL